LKDFNGFSRFYSSYELNLRFWLPLVLQTQDEQLASEMTDFRLFQMAMNLGRKMWIPQGVKSQQQDYMIQRVIAEKVLEKEKEQKILYIEENKIDLSKEEDRKEYENCTRETLWL
jgi:hypothetical protein